MGNYIVAVTDYGFPDLQPEEQLLQPLGFRFVTGQCKTAAEVGRLCREADAVLTQWAPVTAEAIAQMDKCKIIVRYGIGVDNVDLDAASEKGIPVVNVPDYAVQEVADHTLALLLSLMRKIPAIAEQVRGGVWQIAPRRPIIGLKNKTIGTAGFGNIAREVIRRAKAFGMRAVAYDPYVADSAFQELGVERVDWNGLLAESDILSVHLPLTKDTKHILNGQAFEAMKPGAYLINTSRGGVVHTGDLVAALERQALAGAALDVLETEPIEADHPLLRMDQAIVTSHCAWYSEDSFERLQRYAALEIKRLFTGERPLHVINKVEPQPLG